MRSGFTKVGEAMFRREAERLAERLNAELMEDHPGRIVYEFSGDLAISFEDDGTCIGELFAAVFGDTPLGECGPWVHTFFDDSDDGQDDDSMRWTPEDADCEIDEWRAILHPES